MGIAIVAIRRSVGDLERCKANWWERHVESPGFDNFAFGEKLLSEWIDEVEVVCAGDYRGIFSASNCPTYIFECIQDARSKLSESGMSRSR